MNYCEGCTKFKTDNCAYPGMQKCTGYIPKEKPMENKVILTEEQAIEIIKVIFNTNASNFDYAISELKKAGYIRKSAVEEAEEMYEAFKTRVIKDQEYYEEMCRLEELAVKLYEALQYLVAENGRLKK